MKSGVQFIAFDLHTRKCELNLVGHASESLQQAHEILTLILGGHGRWHIIHINAWLPEGYMHPSEMIMRVIGQGFD